MANKGVKGRIVIAGTEQGIPKLTVSAFDIDPISGDDHLGTIVTEEDGIFSVTYEPSKKYRAWFLDRNPDIEVRIYGHGQRLLWETPIEEDVTEETLDLGKIEIHENNIPVSLSASEEEKNDDKYWLVTHTSLDPKGGEAVRLTRGNQLQWLIDGAAMFPAITDAIEKAGTSIKFINTWFRVNEFISKFEFPPVPPGTNHTNVKATDTVKVFRLERIMKRRADADDIPVHVLVWDLVDLSLFNWIFDILDTASQVRDYFQSSKVLTGVLETTEMMHMKFVVIDGETAFVIGSPMSQSYFSDDEHLIRDARHRGPETIKHDVSASLKGPAVRFIDQTFSTVWNAGLTAGAPVAPNPQSNPLPGGVSLQVLRTMPGGLFATSDPDEDPKLHYTCGMHPSVKVSVEDYEAGNNKCPMCNTELMPGENIPHGETGILEAYQRAISKAEQYIYVEDQYFTSPEIARAIRQQMKRVSGLEVIIVLNIKPDVPGYPQKQAALLNELMEDSQIKDRLGVFTLWSFDATRLPFEIKNIYVHSKVAIIDDKWATVGSANLDGASLNQRQWELMLKGIWDELGEYPVAFPFWRWVFLPPLLSVIVLLASFINPELLPFIGASIKKEVARTSQHANPNRERQPPRHPELNLVLYNGIAGQPQSASDKDKIVELRKKLWEEHLGVTLDPTKPAEGWVCFWKNIADSHLAAIRNASEYEPFTEPKAKILEWKPDTDQYANLRSLGIKKIRNIRVRDRGIKLDFIPKEV